MLILEKPVLSVLELNRCYWCLAERVVYDIGSSIPCPAQIGNTYRGFCLAIPIGSHVQREVETVVDLCVKVGSNVKLIVIHVRYQTFFIVETKGYRITDRLRTSRYI